jgi:hypothetical protein
VWCTAVAAPPCLSFDLAASTAPFVTSVVLDDDVIPRTSLLSLFNLQVKHRVCSRYMRGDRTRPNPNPPRSSTACPPCRSRRWRRTGALESRETVFLLEPSLRLYNRSWSLVHNPRRAGIVGFVATPSQPQFLEWHGTGKKPTPGVFAFSVSCMSRLS